MTLDGGPLEDMSDWEPVAHSVLIVTLDGRPMEGIPDLEPLEHSVLVMALDSGLTEGMPHLEQPWSLDLWRGPQFWNR